jgi:hypothetical protein
MNVNEMNVKQLKAHAKTSKISLPAKANKAAILAAISAAAKPARRRGPSTKEVLRSLFSKANAAFTLEELAKQCDTVKLNTVETAIVDLKNKKWSVGPVLILAKNEKKQYVVAS